MHKKTIDPVTGRIFLKHSLQDELNVKEKRIFGNLEERLDGTESQQEYEQDVQAEMKQSVIREMSLDNSGGKLIPDKA